MAPDEDGIPTVAAAAPMLACTTAQLVVQTRLPNSSCLPQIQAVLDDQNLAQAGPALLPLEDDRDARRIAIVDPVAKTQTEAAAYAFAIRFWVARISRMIK